MDPGEIGALARDVGIPVAVLLVILWLFLTGRVHSDGEYQDMKAQRDRALRQVERSLHVTEQTTPIVREAVHKRAEISNLNDLAQIVDKAREQGLIQ